MLWRHVEAETKAQTQFREELAAWLPKIIYGMVAVYIIIQIFKSAPLCLNYQMKHVE